MASQVRQNYHQESEEGVNKQINMELYAMYTYLSMVRTDMSLHTMYLSSFVLHSHPLPPHTHPPHTHTPPHTHMQSYYFDRDDVALAGFAKYFKKSAEEELEHAQKFMKYQNQRGGRIVLQAIKKPEKDEWGTGE